MNSKAAAVLDLLGDGEWHFIKSLKERLRLSGWETEDIFWFLEEFDLVEVDLKTGKVKVRDDFRNLPELFMI